MTRTNALAGAVPDAAGPIAARSVAAGPWAAVVLAAGLGTRMKSTLAKAMHELAGRPLVGHVVAALAPLAPARVVVIAGPGMADVIAAARDAAPALAVEAAIQEERRGTGHAVAQARAALAGFAGDVVVLYADVPLIRTATIARAIATRRAGDHAAVVIGMRPPEPGAYGRLVLGADGLLERIVEAADADAATRALTLCNSGLMALDGRVLFDLLGRLQPHNAQGEYYLTDLIAHARAMGRSCATVEGEAAELTGVNSRAELAAAEQGLQAQLRAAAMAGGATLIDPQAVWFCFDTALGRDVVIEPSVCFGPGVTIGDGVRIGAFTYLERTTVPAGSVLPPFTGR
jgi:bifunctional UDP-N-acetylglucosamine pyrophosphorylase/glucosamine-1-phosphate N-acetyltransferase